jgi:hypothetical protein
MTELFTEIWIHWIIFINYLATRPELGLRLSVAGIIVILLVSVLLKGRNHGICKS